MTRLLRLLKGAFVWCDVCQRRTPHLTEVDGWRQCTVCSTETTGVSDDE